MKSAQRRLVFSLTVTGILYVSGMESTWVVIAAVWIIPFTAFDTFVINYDLQFDVILALIIGENDTFDIYAVILTLPFNFKFWSNACKEAA